jgi:hypothetical protein
MQNGRLKVHGLSRRVLNQRHRTLISKLNWVW